MINMIKTKEEILEQIKSKIGDSTDDNDLALLENISDTLDDLKSRVSEAGDWKTKYEENDKAWKQKYRDRFFNTEAKEEIEEHEKEKEKEMEIDEPKNLTFDALFKTEDGSTN